MVKVNDKVRLTEKARKLFGATVCGTSEEAVVIAITDREPPSTPSVEVYRLGKTRHWDSAWLEKVPSELKDTFYVVVQQHKFQEWHTWPDNNVDGYTGALCQAKREADKNPGKKFFVCEMKATVECEVPKPTVTIMEVS